MAKLSREAKLRERRVEKKMKKEARKLATAEHPDGSSEERWPSDAREIETVESAE